MFSNSMFNNPKKDKEIDSAAEVLDQIGQLCMSPLYSDVTFIVQNTKIPAHRSLLAVRSEYFRAMLFGGLAESKQDEIRLEIPLEAFKVILRYIYTGHMSLFQLKDEHILETLDLAKEYGFGALEKMIWLYLKGNIGLENCCAILDAAHLYGLEELIKACLSFMDRNSTKLLQHSTLRKLSEISLCSLIKRSSFYAPEVEIFNAVHDWYQVNLNANKENVISCVRWPLMNYEQLTKTVRLSGFLHSERLLDVITEKLTKKYAFYREATRPEENVASANHNPKTILDETGLALFDGNVKTFVSHHITDKRDKGIIVELDTNSIINHIKILLYNRDASLYSYFIEVSVDQMHWDRVIDHTKYECRSWQHLYFPSQAVRFIRLVGTLSTSTNKNRFNVISLEAMYTEHVPKCMNGLVMPTHNVATGEMGAEVISGYNPDALLNGKSNSLLDYTYHNIGNEAIVIRLGQPYYVESMRLLLYSLENQTYAFYIETSINGKNWEMAGDNRNKQSKSWQQFKFNPRPIVLIRIVGTYSYNTTNFRCIHFECPSQACPIIQVFV